jgi:uncharacterized membrane protein
MIADSLPRGRLVGWALLIPIAYAPLYLLGTRPGTGAFLTLGAGVALAALALGLILYTQVLDRLATRAGRVAGPIMTLVIAGYVVVSSLAMRDRLLAFANADQAALFSQSFWTLLRGHPFSNTVETVDGTLGSHFGVHFSPTLLLLVPLHALFPGPLVLCVAQALGVALTIVPFYHLLRRDIGPAGALPIALAALAVPNLFWAGMRDFHDASFLPVLLTTAIWALENRRLGVFLLAALGALGLREEMGITIAILGVYAVWRGLGARVAFGIAALGALWMVVVLKLVMPRFWTPGLWIDPPRFFVDVLGQWGATPVAAATAMLTHPAALAGALFNGQTARYLLNLLAPLLLLPPLADPVWLAGLPGLSLNLLSRLRWMRNASSYYSLVPITFFALAAARTAVRVSGRAPLARRAATEMAIGIVMLAGAIPSLPISAGQVEYPIPPAAPARAVVGLIPATDAVYAPISLYPALCNREIFACWESMKEFGRDSVARGRYDWIVLWPASAPPGEPRDRPLADSLAADPRFRAVSGYEPFVVFHRRGP